MLIHHLNDNTDTEARIKLNILYYYPYFTSRPGTALAYAPQQTASLDGASYLFKIICDQVTIIPDGRIHKRFAINVGV
jgi:hypothetical protein